MDGELHGVQPIYQVGTGYQLGQQHGKEWGEQHEVIAKPGYAVGAVNARWDTFVNAIQLVFYRIDGQRLDPSDSYESNWIGGDRGELVKADGLGDPITGIVVLAVNDVVGLGIQPAPIFGTTHSPPAEVGSADDESAPTSHDYRTWTSADGNFSVEANMLGSEDGNVRLERRDGTIITVPLTKLSDRDQAYVHDSTK